MSDSIRFFEEAARVGEVILVTLAGSQSSKKVANYFDSSSKIYHLMSEVHDEVTNLAVQVSLARDLDEAKLALSRLDNEKLTDIFRARDWCDQFERLGQELLPLGDELKLPEADRAIWGEFCNSLSLREGEVAYLYEDKLYELRRLSDSRRSLESLKQVVDRITNRLVTQKAKFDLLAKKAETMQRQMQ